MPPNKLLVDSSYLYALLDQKNEKHADAALIAGVHQGVFVIPNVVLTEVAYLFNRRGGVPAVVQFLARLIAMQPQLEAVQVIDLMRAREIMATFSQARLDFVDCCIMALSERLDIYQVCTFDHRDFHIFRPKHVTHLEILP
jgi:predicted nucleic acid-binding protein